MDLRLVSNACNHTLPEFMATYNRACITNGDAKRRLNTTNATLETAVALLASNVIWNLAAVMAVIIILLYLFQTILFVLTSLSRLYT